MSATVPPATAPVNTPAPVEDGVKTFRGESLDLDRVFQPIE